MRLQRLIHERHNLCERRRTALAALGERLASSSRRASCLENRAISACHRHHRQSLPLCASQTSRTSLRDIIPPHHVTIDPFERVQTHHAMTACARGSAASTRSIILRLRLFVHAHELRLHLLAQRARETNGVERDVEFAGVRAAVETERRGGIGARGGGERDAGRARATAAGGRGGRRAREGWPRFARTRARARTARACPRWTRARRCVRFSIVSGF